MWEGTTITMGIIVYFVMTSWICGNGNHVSDMIQDFKEVELPNYNTILTSIEYEQKALFSGFKRTTTISARLTNQLTPWLMEPGGSMPLSQELSNIHILSRINPIPRIDTYLFKVHSNIVLPSTPRPSFDIVIGAYMSGIQDVKGSNLLWATISFLKHFKKLVPKLFLLWFVLHKNYVKQQFAHLYNKIVYNQINEEYFFYPDLTKFQSFYLN